MGRGLLWSALGVAAARALLRGRRARGLRLAGQVVLITGGSRGLGLLLARAFAREGCRIAICARDPAELERARLNLANAGVEALALTCDVSDRAQAEDLVARTAEHFGRLDVLVNNAGIIQVGPLESMTILDFERALAVNFWGTVHTALAAAAAMKAAGPAGRIVNVTSIGGVLPMPHLLPYDCAKFAALGFSEGLRAELAGDGISVTTVIPGLMRTGSYTNALFKGRPESEFAWFSRAASARLTAMDARTAARKIVRAAKLRDPELVLGWQAKLARVAKDLWPGLVIRTLAAVNRRQLPADAGGGAGPLVPGRQLAEEATRRELRSEPGPPRW